MLSEKAQGLLKIVISAPSGAGKTTLWKRLVASDKRIHVSVSCTTRPRRPGEREGLDYFFVTEEQFLSMIRKNEFLEWAEVHGHYYGTPYRNLEVVEEEGKDILFEVDVQGARSIKEKVPDAVTIFIMPPSIRELRLRLERRGQDSPEEIEKRLIHAREEIRSAEDFDYIILNDDLDRAERELKAIITSERLRTSRNLHVIENVLQS